MGSSDMGSLPQSAWWCSLVRDADHIHMSNSTGNSELLSSQPLAGSHSGLPKAVSCLASCLPHLLSYVLPQFPIQVSPVSFCF